ncbi:MAG TPA: hypothetical protein VIH96_19670 [Paraburkholderia sp.]|jgi:hypothetical protein
MTVHLSLCSRIHARLQNFLHRRTPRASRRGARVFAAALGFAACTAAPLVHAECRPTGTPGALRLPLAPVRIAVPKNTAEGTLLGATHAALVQDIPYACSGPVNTRELRVDAPRALDASGEGFGDLYATSVLGIGMRIVTRGGSFAGIDDGPRNAPYSVELPPHANRLTGFAIDVQFIKTGAGAGGVLAPGKIASVVVGGTTLVDVIVPNGGIAFDATQCAPVNVGGEMSAGVGTMGAFTQEAAVIGRGCGGSGVNVVFGIEQGYVYGAHRSLTVDAPGARSRASASALADFGTAGSARVGLSRTRNSAFADNVSSDYTSTGPGSVGATGSSGAGGFGGARH